MIPNWHVVADLSSSSCFFDVVFFFFNGKYLFWNCFVNRWCQSFFLLLSLFSVKSQHESAIGVHISPPGRTSLPSSSPSDPSRLIQSPCSSFLSHTASSHWLFTKEGCSRALLDSSLSHSVNPWPLCFCTLPPVKLRYLAKSTVQKIRKYELEVTK